MKIFIFEQVENLTSQWHPGGGLVIIAKDKRSARKINNCPTEEEWKKVKAFDIQADKEEEFVFPDSGCC